MIRPRFVLVRANVLPEVCQSQAMMELAWAYLSVIDQ